MPTPNKPTEEELKAKEEEAIELAEELEGRQTIPEEEATEDEDIEVVTSPNEEEQEEEESQDKTPEQVVEEAEPSKELYKKKFSASSKENQKINAKNRVINKALADAEDVPEPTEEELQSIYGDWDIMSDVEKHLVKETEITKRWRETIAQAKEQASKIEKWNESVGEFAGDPKTLNDNPELEGKIDEFIGFATEEANNNVPFNILVGAFLHSHSTKKPNNKGRMFEKGSGGPNDKPQVKKGTITLDEARQLRETNYTKYKEYLTAGKIETDL